jgi:ArsR family transcriptional regulator
MELLKISQPILSHHMRILCDSGLVACRKDGKWSYYAISPEGVESFKEMISSYTKCDNGKKCPNS